MNSGAHIHKYMNEFMITWRNKQNHCTDTLIKEWMGGSINPLLMDGPPSLCNVCNLYN